MTDFLKSVRADLLDRRLLPILALVGVGLAAALAYAVLGGGGSTPATPPPSSSAAPALPGASAITASQAQANPDQSVAETTSGSSHQRAGLARNPFTPLPGSTSTTSPSSSPSTSSSTIATGSSGAPSTGSLGPSTKSEAGSSSPGSGGTEPTATPKSSAPANPETVYRVAVLFAGSPPQSTPLALFRNLSRQAVLPSSKAPVIAFRGVMKGGKSAMFTLVGKAILRGHGVCRPSASQCQAITLQQGQTEELEYPQPSGSAIIYQLQVLTISASKASTAAARLMFASESKAGREVLRQIGLAALPAGVLYSRLKGVLVSAGRSASARAASERPPHGR